MSLNYYQNIDHFLGDRSGRYFGDGYLGTNYSIDDFHLSQNDNKVEFTGIGKVQLPQIWSQKGEKSQTPHLSTIDVIELSLECLRLYMLPDYNVNTNFLPTDHLLSLSIKAGNTPVENNLSAIQISGSILKNKGNYDTIEICIANMIIFMDVVCTKEKKARCIAQSRNPVYLNEIYFDDLNLAQSYGTINQKDVSETESWSISSAFASTLQLGQLLLYKLDNINRSNSNTLWMKRTKIVFFDEVPLVKCDQPIRSQLRNVRKYAKPDGIWRRADIVATLCNMQIECAVTHKLPNLDSNTLS